VNFATISLCVASKLVFIFVSTQSGNFWIQPRTVAKTSISLKVIHKDKSYYVSSKRRTTGSGLKIKKKKITQQ